MRRALAAVRPDVINTHGPTDAWLVALARLLLRGSPPVVHTRHTSEPIPKNLLARWLYTRASRHIITTDERLRQALVRENRYRESRVTWIPAEIDQEQPGSDGKLAARSVMISRTETVFCDVIERYRNRRKSLRARWQRLMRSLGRRSREWRLPRGYIRLGTRYGGWWIDRHAIGRNPLLIDCGLGRDISFPAAFLSRFGGTVIGIDPNPDSLAYCRERCPSGMQIWDRAFWTRAGQTLTFHLPRPPELLPMGADGISGSIDGSHAYVNGGDTLTVVTTSLEETLEQAGRTECDVLKLDIEGAEYPVLEDLCTRGLITRARQLLVEFHHRATRHTLAETEATVARVQEAGFRLMHTEERNYIFRRSDLG